MRRRVLLAVLLTTTLAVIAFFVPASVAIRNAQRARRVARAPAGGVDRRQPAGEPRGQRRPGAAGDPRRPPPARPLLDQRRSCCRHRPGAPDRIVRLAMEGNFAEGYVDSDLVAAVPVSATPAHPPLVVRIEEPNTESQRRYYRSLALLAGAALVILTVAAAVGVLVANRLNRPIDELKEWADFAPEQQGAAARSDRDRGARFAALGARRQPHSYRGAAANASARSRRRCRTSCARRWRRCAWRSRPSSPRRGPTRRPCSTRASARSTGSSRRSAACSHSPATPSATAVDCDMLELCRDDVAHWQDAVSRDGRRLIVSGDATRARVDVDAIRHVLDVLVDNALHHGKGDIRVVVRGDAATVAVDVSDEGPAPRDRDPFADAGSDSSHGIGLRLARTLAESSQGRLELLDHENTTFRLTFPSDARRRLPDAHLPLTGQLCRCGHAHGMRAQVPRPRFDAPAKRPRSPPPPTSRSCAKRCAHERNLAPRHAAQRPGSRPHHRRLEPTHLDPPPPPDFTRTPPP